MASVGGEWKMRDTGRHAFLAEMPMDRRVRDYVLESFELADDEGAVGPWTGIGDVEVVAEEHIGYLLLSQCSSVRSF